MKEWMTKKFKFEKDLYFCFDCGKTFDLYFLTEQYGYRSLICNQCAKTAYLNWDEDEEFQRLYKQYEDMHPGFRKLDPDEPRKQKLFQDFEKTCDPCDCGGKFVMKVKDKCPYCLSENIDELRTKKDFEFVDMVPNWVTHKKVK